MERNNISDSFERMLKEKADEFRMYPSARVWHSLYNNMHPGRRWPSLTMCIILITALLMIGYTNSTITNQPKTQISKARSIITTTSNKQLTDNNNSIKNTVANSDNNQFDHNIIIASSKSIASSHSLAINTFPTKTNSAQKTTINTIEQLISKSNNSNRSRSKLNFVNSSAAVKLSEKTDPKKVTLKTNNYLTIKENNSSKNFTVANVTTEKKEDGKFGWQVYASPSLVFRNISDNSIDNSTTHNDANTAAQKPAMGLEVGASVQYALLKKLKLKTGLQLNYTNYNSPNSQNFDIDNINSVYPVMLNNETYQVSIPVGVEVKLFGKERLHWDVGATIQPSYLIGGGNNYMTTSGKMGYMKESSMRNNWNLNAGFETFITYKMNGLTWQLGPQFRYQFTSTYNRNFLINENLSNYGVKLGVSKVLN